MPLKALEIASERQDARPRANSRTWSSSQVEDVLPIGRDVYSGEADAGLHANAAAADKDTSHD
jgi:hypothetical protein